MSESGLYNFSRVRSEQQRALYERLDKAGVCMFCEEGHGLGEIPVIKVGKYWTLARNRYPYKDSAGHYLCIYGNHVTNSAEVADGAWPELFSLFREQVRAEFGHENFGIGIRHGDMQFTCATIAHLHVHCFVGVAGEPPDNTIKMDLGYTKR